MIVYLSDSLSKHVRCVCEPVCMNLMQLHKAEDTYIRAAQPRSIPLLQVSPAINIAKI